MSGVGETLLGCLVLAVIGAAGLVLLTQGPIAWYVAASLLGYLIFIPLSRRARPKEEGGASLRQRIVASALDDGRKVLRNLAIAFAMVLVLQLSLNLFAEDVDASVVGTTEQRIWDFLARLTSFGSLRLALLITLISLAVSALIGNVLPVVLTTNARKLVSTGAALLASVMMFSFVTEEAAGRNIAAATGPIRARLVTRLTETAKARQETAAYGRVIATIAMKRRTQPAQLARLGRYFREGERICDHFEGVYQQGGPTQTYVGAFAPTAYGRPDDKLCAKPELARVMTRSVLKTAAVAGPPALEPAPWLPDFADRLTAVSPDPADPLPFDLKEGSLADLEALAAKVEKAALRAEAVRESFRGLATESVGKVIGRAFVVDGAVGEVVNVLRDAALGELAKHGDGKVREALAYVARQRVGPIADAAARLHAAAYPDQPLAMETFTSEAKATAAAKMAWAEFKPAATSVAEVRGVAVAAVTAAHLRRSMAMHPPMDSFHYRPPPSVRPRIVFRR